MSKTGIIIQARTNSSRFPHKVTRTLGDSTVLGNVIKRCSKVGARYRVILACPDSDVPELGPIANYFGADVFGGSELDVLDRYYQCAKKYELTHIVRITSDCWAVDPDIIRLVTDVLLNNPQYDYVSNVGQRTWPTGLDVEAFTFECLAVSNKYCKDPYKREHVGLFMRLYDVFAKANIRCPVPFIGEFKHWWCIDYQTDLEFARQIWKHLPPNFNWRDVLQVTQDHPEIINPREGGLK